MGKPLEEVATAEAVAEEDRDLDRGLGSAVWTAALVLHMGGAETIGKDLERLQIARRGMRPRWIGDGSRKRVK